jgi:ferritin heavy chain
LYCCCLQVASAQNDPQLGDFVESEFLEEQVESLKEIADMLTTLARVGNDGLGLHLFDRDLLEKLK